MDVSTNSETGDMWTLVLTVTQGTHGNCIDLAPIGILDYVL